VDPGSDNMPMRAWLSENLGLKLLSVAIAVFLWAVVLGDQKVERSVSIPLEVRELPADLVVLNEPTHTVEVRLRGPRTLVSTLTSDEVILQGVPGPLVEGENTFTIRPEAIRVPRGIEVVGVSPQRVRLLLDRIAEREVEVGPRVEGSPAAGCVLKRVTVSPPRVRMTGPQSELRRITRVYTIPINLDGQSASFSARAMLEPPGRRIRTVDQIPIIVEVEIVLKGS